MDNFFVYILYNKKHDKFYIGHTNDINRREFEHNNKLSTYTSKYNGTWNIVYKERFSDRAGAMKREKLLKKQKSKEFYKKLAGLLVG